MSTSSRPLSAGIGIDLGTSNSAVCRAHLDKGKPTFEFARDLSGGKEIVSAIYIDSNGHLYHGRGASRRQADGNEQQRVLSNLKQLRSNQPLVIEGVSHEPVMLMRAFIAYLKRCYEQNLSDGQPLTRAVITVPAGANFDVDYRANLAAAIAGPSHEPLFDEWEMLEEPDAALLSLVDLRPLDGQRVLVFDMGGGTLDVSIRTVEASGGQPKLLACGIEGSPSAGAALTDALTNFAIDQWAANSKRTFSAEERADICRRNFWRSDESKLLLSAAAVQDDDIWSERPYDVPLSYGGAAHTVEVTVADLTRLSEPLAASAQATVLSALGDAGLTPRDVDSYFMVGGSSQLPVVRQMMQELLGKAPNPVIGNYGKMDINLAVVRGAALFGMQGYKGASATAAGPASVAANGSTIDEPRPSSSTIPAAPVEVAEDEGYILPMLERRLPYDISLRGVKQDVEIAEVIIPKGTLLPSEPITRTFYMQRTGSHMDFHFMRGAGDPRLCTALLQRKFEFDERREEGEPVTVSITMTADGQFSITTDDEGILVAATMTGAA